MPAYRDYECPQCAEVLVDYLGEAARPPICPRCWAEDQLVTMCWKPSFAAGGFSIFKTPLTLPIGPGGTTVSTLREVRQLEKWSEQNARNGEGEQYVARAWAQNPSNLDAPTLKGPPEQRPGRSKDHKGRPKLTITQHAAEPTVELGAGLTGHSALSKDGQ